MQTTILGWIAIMSIWAFIAMGYDKRQAKRKGRRIPEKDLWTLALLGGGIGAYFGMQVFRHKTRHTSFRVGFLILAMAYGIGVLFLLGVSLPGIVEA
ncbi:MAG TPA: DUF1294 domain-containing protein [Sporosarcina psychrophila]|uniref:DUF1294 domain-containing protein n=1 Tax=Sporosarcina psychrophila TaxID=1476 RepID=A0A921G1C9_SPOPS|nr:DUF1294 domain-containing protein [Sporosarcina psychrophila]